MPLNQRLIDWNAKRKARKAARKPSPLVEFERSRSRRERVSKGLRTVGKTVAAVGLVAAIGYGAYGLKSRGDAKRVQQVIELYEKSPNLALRGLYPSMAPKAMVALDQFSRQLNLPLLTVLKAIEVSGVSVSEVHDAESYARQAQSFSNSSIALSKKSGAESKAESDRLDEIVNVLNALGKAVAQNPKGDLVSAIEIIDSTASTKKIVLGAESAWRASHH